MRFLSKKIIKKIKKSLKKHLTKVERCDIIKVQRKEMEDLKMAKAKWYKWTWADGTVTYCRGYDRAEKAAMDRQHGKLVGKVLAY